MTLNELNHCKTMRDYHGANSRFHNVQKALLSHELKKFKNDPIILGLHKYHSKMSARHRKISEQCHAKIKMHVNRTAD